MKKCAICGVEKDHPTLQIREMQHCIKEWFEYFQCLNCECIQITSIPGNISKYYPSDYYSFTESFGDDLLKKPAGFFHRKQATHLLGDRNTILGALFSVGYQPPALFQWIKFSSIHKKSKILDIGTGTGWLLKKMWHYGYQDLTGVDPFISRDYIYPGKLRVLKQNPLELDESQPFDLIMMHHSLEHMPDQSAIFNKIHRLLTPDGTLLVRIPIYSKVLMDIYGADLISLDAPRHFFIHSITSFALLAAKNGFHIERTIYDADSSSFWASEQYKKDICLNSEQSYGRSPKKSIFSKEQIRTYRKQIQLLNEQKQSDTAAFYLKKK